MLFFLIHLMACSMAMSSEVKTDRSALPLMPTLTSLKGSTKAASVAGWSGSLLQSVKTWSLFPWLFSMWVVLTFFMKIIPVGGLGVALAP